MATGATNSNNVTLTTYGCATPAGYQQITSYQAAIGLTVPTSAKWALIQVETAAMRWRDDGTNPTASVGMPVAAADTLVYTGTLSAFKAIESTGGGKLNITYYK